MSKKMSSARVVLMGGLGNQLFQYAYALRLSRLTKSRVSLNPNLATVRRDDHGKTQISNYILNPNIAIESDQFPPRIVKRFLGTGLRLSGLTRHRFGALVHISFLFINKLILTFYFKENISINISRNTGYWRSRLQNNSSFNIGYFQSYKYSENPEDLEALRTLTPRIVYSGQDALSQMAKRELPLVVHVRLADYKIESNFGIPSNKYYENAITFQMSLGLYKKIWLFSDEPSEAMNFIPDAYLDQVRCISNEITDPIWSLEAMRLGSGYVIANSTFSWWGAYLSHTQDPVIVFPKPWFQGMPDPIEICPPSWKPFAR